MSRWGVWVLGLACALAVRPAPAADPADPGPWLVFDIAIGWGMGPADYDGRSGARFEVKVAEDGRTWERLFRAEYAQLRWFPCAVNLAKYAGKRVRLRLMVEHLEGRIMMDYPHWGDPRIVTGPLVGGAPQTDVHLAMSPIERIAALLPDGSGVALGEPDPIFQTGLVTPGRLNREQMLLVYAGDNYICVPGKRQPGLYMGVSMSVDYLRIGAGPDRKPWTGKLPPPVFAEWTVQMPQRPAATAPVTAPSHAARPAAGGLSVLQSRADTPSYRPGLLALADPQGLTMRTGMGPNDRVGWAFAALELAGAPEPTLTAERAGKFTVADPNAFAGLVVDYHSPRGYQDRVFLGLGAGSAARSDLRPAAWIYDGPPLTLARTLGMHSRYVDLSPRIKGTRSDLRLPLSGWAPADWDGRVWLAAGVQNLPAGATLAVRLHGRPAAQPAETPAAPAWAVLEDKTVRYAISRRTGAIAGARELTGNRRLLSACNDRYTFDTEHDVTRTGELLDRVTSLRRGNVQGRPGLVAECTNLALPGTVIEKRYVLLPGRVLAKRVGFRTAAGTGFIHWDADTALDPVFMAGGSRVGDAPLITARDFSLGLAAYRCAVNGRFVLKGAAKSGPTGWQNTVFVDWLRPGRPVSGEVRWVVFEGDFTAFERHYQALPDYQALWRFRRPEWVQRVVGDAMYLGPPETFPFYRACSPELVTSTIWFLNPPWGNWGPDSEPPKSLHPDVKGIARGWRHEFPNARVAAYTNALFDDKSDIFRDHPDFAVRDLEGNPITSGIASDSGGRPTFYFQIDNPACRAYLLDMHASKFRAWEFDFFYMDGPGFGAEVPDWSTRQVAQGYDWLDYFATLRERLQAIKPDAAIFVNGPNLPYSDFGYIEYRDEQWQALAGKDWRPLATELLRAKLNEPQGMVIVPTYGTPEADPALASYTILYGWMGSLAVVGRLPWMREALRYRGARLVEDAVEPRWWRGGESFEAVGLRQGERALVGVLQHGAEAGDVGVAIDTAKLGLTEGRPLYAQLRRMNDTASEQQPDPADASRQVRVWRNAEAVTVSELFAGRPCPRVLRLQVPARPMLTSTVVLAHMPEALR